MVFSTFSGWLFFPTPTEIAKEIYNNKGGAISKIKKYDPFLH